MKCTTPAGVLLCIGIGIGLIAARALHGWLFWMGVTLAVVAMGYGLFVYPRQWHDTDT